NVHEPASHQARPGRCSRYVALRTRQRSRADSCAARVAATPYLSMASEAAESWGLAALGVVEDVCVELLEGIEDRSGQWLLQVDIGQFGFTCELCSPERLRELTEFFAETFRTGR